MRRLALLVPLVLVALAPAAGAAGLSVSYTIRSTAVAGTNGWYRSDVTADIKVDGATDTSCPQVRTFKASGDVVDCTATDGTSTVSFHLQFRIDKDAPSVTGATPDRGANPTGWYTAPLNVQFTGSDATSGIASCQQVPYSGPDNGAASVTGTCTDQAGNVSIPGSWAFKYDATPPKLTGIVVDVGNRTARLTWKASPDTAQVAIARAAGKAPPVAVYRGPGRAFTDRKVKNGVRYHYTLAAVDQAGNTATATAVATPRALTSPVDGSKLKTPPLLRWVPVAKASYYNVQLFHGRTKVLSAWPKVTKLRLARAWTFEGHRFRLAAGRYRWYVWPGFGARKTARYGKLLGGSTFNVVR